ncbi:type I DNA topoisomerase [Anaplasma capra]|uniref:type I DNA topoisomerase n=1 Tax=Anaplasma capra TaxID=1562740 RepID=UPI0021D5ACAB|nr:type I DNA topoisomerase [Anaplasma capra]MCU7611489.1 type I DNA topoisomerase [Anaplasma capra]MCU7612072.1 type I DNA topoisomerase [Anaplasma capra]
MSVVIVESPSKARTISKYLGGKYKVVASFGHVRDFPAKSGSVDPDDDFRMIYEIIPKSERHIDKIVKTVSSEKGGTIYLATDPDREGEAIAWHIVEVLRERSAISRDVTVSRMVFNEVTKKAVVAAISDCRGINMDLVHAQQARRALDYLVGFTLSPLLWRKLPGSRSAGRVQSVALRLVCEREYEIERFESREYWDIGVILKNQHGEEFATALKHYDGEKLDKFSITSAHQANAMAERVGKESYRVASVEAKQTKRNPYPPFITSSLQQEASNKLGFSAKNTMVIAQKLYEGIDIAGETVGLITYMRTDGFYISSEAVSYIRDTIKMQFGAKYLAKSVRQYVKKVKNAQEAHEAIRPTDITMTPDSLAQYLSGDQLKLYDLIWRRTMASQMESAVIDQVIVDVQSPDGSIGLHAVGSSLSFDGYYKVYGSDDEDKRKMLPQLKVGEDCSLLEVIPSQHFTQPPPRYSEAGLVKKMEEIGIGRPSTYATIISVLQDRGYTNLEQKRFVPSERGRIVNAFLTNFFSRYVEYDFTANLEEELDLISNGNMAWKEVLRQFWSRFIADVSAVKGIEVSDILKSITKDLEMYAFSSDSGEVIDRRCPGCGEGELMLNIGKYKAFLGCNKYPECKYTRGIGSEAGVGREEFPKVLGLDDATQEEIFLKNGPYGEYLQLGDNAKGKRVAVPQGIKDITLDVAKKLLSLPMVLGCYPNTTQDIKLGIGRFGPYVLYGGTYFSVKGREDFLNLTFEEAVSIIDSQAEKKARLLGLHGNGKEIYVCKGRYGFYLKCDKKSVAIKGKGGGDITLEEAVSLLDQKP